MRGVDFSLRPILVFWEATKACMLKCEYCRAEAIEEPLPGELSTEEAKKFIASLRGFGRPYPVLIITGGDPLMRRDIYELVSYARDLELPVALALSATPLLTREAASRLKSLGVRTVSIALDGGSSETHDRLRGVEGHFEETMRAIKLLTSTGFKVQINCIC
jgi:MoaA/NifB/PqqE/SkfB family radical SAM enzyme